MKKYFMAALLMAATMNSFAQDAKLRTGNFGNEGWDDWDEEYMMDLGTEEVNIKGEYFWYCNKMEYRLYVTDDSHYTKETYDVRRNLVKVEEGTYMEGAEPDTYYFDFNGVQRTLTLTVSGLTLNGILWWHKLI